MIFNFKILRVDSYCISRLHLQNAELCKTQQKLENRITKGGKEFEGLAKFGFHINTCCGYLEMNNSWKDDWPVRKIFVRSECFKKLSKIVSKVVLI